MEIIPIEYCDTSDAYIHLYQRQCDCAFEHGCESTGTDCPLKPFFSPPPDARSKEPFQRDDMPDFYFIT
ncbi:MAG: hypothetical protein PVJ39_02380 [Gammaproteobacteria bacterium]|jgi:hypothetical protein